MAIGCIGEVAHEMGGQAIAPHVAKALPVAMRLLADEKPAVRRNSAFACGELVMQGGAQAQAMFAQLAQALQPLFEERALQQPSEPYRADARAARDNAVSCICKMYLVNPDGFPLTQLLPVILRGCPITDDWVEAPIVYNTLCEMLKTKFDAIADSLPLIFEIFSQVFGNPEIEVEDQQKWIQFLKHLLASIGYVSFSCLSPSLIFFRDQPTSRCRVCKDEARTCRDAAPLSEWRAAMTVHVTIL